MNPIFSSSGGNVRELLLLFKDFEREWEFDLDLNLEPAPWLLIIILLLLLLPVDTENGDLEGGINLVVEAAFCPEK